MQRQCQTINDDHERGKMLRDTLNLVVDGHSDSENPTCSKEF